VDFGNPAQLIRSYPLFEVILEMAVIWACVFVVFRFLRGTRGAGVVKGFAILLVLVTLLTRVLGHNSDTFARLNFIYDRFLGLLAVMLVVVFQPELRQALIRLSTPAHFRGPRSQHKVVTAIADAALFLSKNQFGAIIAVERSVQLGGLIETGQLMDAQVSARLLETVFWPNSPLHDLGVVIRGERILAAGVQFPLAEEGSLPPNVGSRHRAAMGVTLESDCVVVVVSEETGSISIAENGRIDFNIPRDEVAAILARRLQATVPPLADRPTVLEQPLPETVLDADNDQDPELQQTRELPAAATRQTAA
jgi:diadenylate cyclase